MKEFRFIVTFSRSYLIESDSTMFSYEVYDEARDRFEEEYDKLTVFNDFKSEIIWNGDKMEEINPEDNIDINTLELYKDSPLMKMKKILNNGDIAFTTGAFIVRNDKIPGGWEVSGFEDDTFYAGKYVNSMFINDKIEYYINRNEDECKD